MGLVNEIINKNGEKVVIETMNCLQVKEAFKRIKGWEITSSFSVGGFLYLGFSKNMPGKMIVISDSKAKILDCNDGSLVECNAEYDEREYVAICDMIEDEYITLVGPYGGSISHETTSGERVEIEYLGEKVTPYKTLKYEQILFVDTMGNREIIYRSNPPYLYGFSDDGNYFVLADDGGIDVLRRI